MTAAGPLAARYRGAHPAPVAGDALAAPAISLPRRWPADLVPGRYHDLWFAVGVWHPRATFAVVAGTDPRRAGCALLDEARVGGAGILGGGDVAACGPSADRYAGEAAALVDRWESEGRPAITDWAASLALEGDPGHPIWVPGQWRIARP
jgi:hypothetical protein